MWYENQSVPLSQEKAIEKFLPIIEESGSTYNKKTKVKARPAKAGEKIDTFTSDGKETTNTAKEGDYVVKNMTEAGEEYILSAKKLKDRYILLEDGDPYSIYKATGKVKAKKYISQEFSLPDTIEFVASWGEKTVLKEGDMIATPLPSKDEVYRIAKKEFEETYEKE